MPRPRVLVLFGGRSTEHGVSCATASGVLGAMGRSAWDPVGVGIARDGRWLHVEGPGGLPTGPDGLPEVRDGRRVTLAADPTAPALVDLDGGAEPVRVDVALPLLHGPFGEDGTVQGLCECAGLPYVGSGVLASAACMDKPTMKALLAAAGLPTPAWTTVTAAAWRDDRAAVRERVAALGGTVFVKPARGGSSVGISRVGPGDDLDAAVAAAAVHDPRVVVEAAVLGREVECGVLPAADGGPAEVSACGEVLVDPSHGFYDFEAKYLDGSTGLDVPADLPDDVTAAVRSAARRAAAALGCEGLARVDVFVEPDGTVVVNEVNTLPGFTPTSMFPRLWEASGVGYGALVDRLLRDALTRGTGLR